MLWLWHGLHVLIGRYLEVEDDGPYQPQDDGGPPVCDVRGMDVDQFDLKKKIETQTEM